jgi:diguanylate cyclase (GGDEF)-like protein
MGLQIAENLSSRSRIFASTTKARQAPRMQLPHRSPELMFDWLALDSRTLLLVALPLVLLNAAALGLLVPSLAEELRPSARSWGVGILLQALGALMLALQANMQSVLPDLVFFPVAHACVLFGMTGYVHALRQFCGLPARAWLLLPALLGSLAIAASTALGAGLAWRIVFTSSALMVLLVLGMNALLDRGPGWPVVSRRVLRAVLAVLAAAVALRAVQAWLDPPQVEALVEISRGPLILQLLLMAALPVVGTSAFFALCSERLRLRWEAAASTDFLTDLANRRSLVSAAEVAILKARQGGEPLSLATIDVDHFKRLNDSLGHAAGDAVLRQLADHLRAACGARDVPARSGGEEFCILAPGRDLEGLQAVLLQLQHALRNQPPRYEGRPARISFSAGVAELSDEDGSFDSLLGRADQALYAAKRSGRDRITCSVRAVEHPLDPLSTSA